MKIRSCFLLLTCLAALPAGALHAQTTTWTGNGGTASPGWSDPTNWTDGVPANGGSPVFGSSSQTTSIQDESSLTIATLTFAAGAPTYSIIPTNLQIAGGAGVVNNSNNSQTFFTLAAPAGKSPFSLVFLATSGGGPAITGDVSILNSGAGLSGTAVGGSTTFTNTSAGGALITNSAATVAAAMSAPFSTNGSTAFTGTGSAGSATILNFGATGNGLAGGATLFSDTATAGSAKIFNSGGNTSSGATGGVTTFSGSATAGAATISNFGGADTNTAGGVTAFSGSATAGTATIYNFAVTGAVSGATGGSTTFSGSANAGTAQINNLGSNVAGGTGGFATFAGTSSASGATINNFAGAGSGASGGNVTFSDSASAGTATFVNNGNSTPGALGGSVVFLGSSTAGGATINNFAGGASGVGGGGATVFSDTSTAGGASITSIGSSMPGAAAGSTVFVGFATAGNANITNYSGSVAAGNTVFQESATAGSATISLVGNVGNGTGFAGKVSFLGNSDGGTARVMFYAGGTLDISGLTGSGMNLGSIEGVGTYGDPHDGGVATGAGTVFLGSKNLSVGGNNRTTSYNGALVDGGTSGGTGGSLTKVGTGTLTLTGASSYTGGTTVSGGTVVVNNTAGSATGTGNVFVANGAAFGGNGAIAGTINFQAGAVLFTGDTPGDVMASSNAARFAGGAAFSAGNLTPGTLTVGGSVSLPADAGMYAALTGTSAGREYGQVRFGESLTLGGTLTLVVDNRFTLAPGMTFTLFEGTGNGRVVGTFANTALAGTLYTDGNGDTFLVDYAANTDRGLVPNDVTLTVLTVASVPEPGTWGCLFAGAGGLLFVMRRRTRRVAA